MQCLVDAFGNVPYSEALMGAENSSPKYDDAQTIYTDLFKTIKAAINAMNAAMVVLVRQTFCLMVI